MKAVICSVLVLGLLGEHVRAQTTVSSLREAAVTREEDLSCEPWDCECALTRQRSCCCANSELRELEDQILLRVLDVSVSLSQLGDSVLEVIGGMRVAFTTYLSPTTGCLGPFTWNSPIPYDVITLNHGSGFNVALGLFTAPCSGLYSFSYSVYSEVGGPGEKMYYKVQLMRDGQVVASTWEDNREDSEDSSSQTVLLSLQQGSQVYVELLSGRQLCGNVQGLNSFSGTLLYPTLI